MGFIVLFVLAAVFLYVLTWALRAAVIDSVERVFARRAQEAEAAMKAAAEEAKATVEALDAAELDDEDDVEGEDVCLRPGIRVRCNLSDCTHTHGVLLGFTMSAQPGGPMLAIVSIGPNIPVMPIDVDRVDPEGGEGDEGGGIPLGYRDSAKPVDKSWN